MTRDEFNECLRDYCRWFVDFSSWAAKVPEATKAAWAERFELVEKRDLLAAIEAIKIGQQPAIAAFEREQTATKLIHLSYEYRRRRERRETDRGTERGRPWGGAVNDAVANAGLRSYLMVSEKLISDVMRRQDVPERSARACEIAKEVSGFVADGYRRNESPAEIERQWNATAS